MEKRNYLLAERESLVHCHGGMGTLHHVSLFKDSDFRSPLRFINYTILPPGTIIGYHAHGEDEEIYIVLDGRGTVIVDGKTSVVVPGDVVLNRSRGSHRLSNDSNYELKILVFDVALEERG